MCEKYPIIKRSSESRKGFPFLKEIKPLHLFTDKKEFLCACNHMLPVASHRQPLVEPFMERVTRTGNGAEWTTGGYGYFSVTGLGARRITDLRYQDGAKPQK